MTATLDPTDRLLAAVLWPGMGARPVTDGVAPAMLAARIRYHGIALLLCQDEQALAALPPVAQGAVRDEARSQVFWEDSHRTMLAGLIDQLDRAGCPSLLLKGTALAYTVHADPAARRRGDSDLLVRKADLATARKVLRDGGFALSQDRQQFQECWTISAGAGFAHTVDLHWQLTNVPALGRALDVEQAFAAAVPLPRLRATALAIDPVRQFLLGSINQRLHRVYGYYVDDSRVLGATRLIWALDNHLLASRFDAGQWDQLERMTLALGVPGLCLEALDLAQAVLGTSVPPAVAVSLRDAPRETWAERYFSAPWTAACLRADLAGCTSLGDRVRLLLGHAWPSAATLRDRHPELAAHSLAKAHLVRLAGLPRHMLAGFRG